MSYEFIKTEKQGNVLLVTMNRPEVYNAVHAEMHQEMSDCWDAFAEDQDLWVAVLTGAGKVFSAGADIKNRAGRERQPGEQWAHSRRGRETFHCIMECKKPVIGALNGPALGAGLAVAASCDMLVSAERGSLGLPEIDVGLLGGGRSIDESLFDEIPGG